MAERFTKVGSSYDRSRDDCREPKEDPEEVIGVVR